MNFAPLAALLSTRHSGVLTGIPYAETLGLEFEIDEGGALLRMPYRKTLIGAPSPPRLHGGTVAGLMEIACMAALLRDETVTSVPALKPIDVTVDYLRAGQPETTYGCATVMRRGRRVANVRVEAWQSDPGAPIAAARMNVMIVGADGSA
ncbi:MAG: PaaI family thioesterase [Pseudomonadota bacterium]